MTKPNYAQYGVTMKKNLLTAILVCAALLVSSMALTGCKTNVDDPASPVEGSWVNKANFEGIFTETWTFSGDSFNDAILFFGQDASTKGTYTYDEKAKTLTLKSSLATKTLTYAVSGSTLTLTDDTKTENKTSTYSKK